MAKMDTAEAVAALVTRHRTGRITSAKDLTRNEIIELVNLQLEGEKSIESEKTCPECGRKMSVLRVADITIDGCRYCRSLWFDLGELKELAGTLDDIPGMRLADRDSRLKCPVCGERMYRKVYMQGANLIVDLCREHGVYLEHGELERALALSE